MSPTTTNDLDNRHKPEMESKAHNFNATRAHGELNFCREDTHSHLRRSSPGTEEELLEPWAEERAPRLPEASLEE